MKIISVDYEKCVGCRICELICSFHHFKIINPLLSSIKVIKFDTLSRDIPLVCEQCKDAPCKQVCVKNSICQTSKTGAYIINRETCIGCKRCIMACPYGTITYTEEFGVIKCDLCNGEPKCVEICPSEAIKYIEAEEIPIEKKHRYIQSLLKI